MSWTEWLDFDLLSPLDSDVKWVLWRRKEADTESESREGGLMRYIRAVEAVNEAVKAVKAIKAVKAVNEQEQYVWQWTHFLAGVV